VTVNSQERRSRPDRVRDTVETARTRKVVFAAAEEAFLLRGGSRMVTEKPALGATSAPAACDGQDPVGFGRE